MSRTVRRKGKSPTECIRHKRRFYVFYSWENFSATVNKSDKFHRDKSVASGWEQFCYHRIHKVRRANDRMELSKIKKLDSYDDFWFNDSRHEVKRKGVLWDIW